MIISSTIFLNDFSIFLKNYDYNRNTVTIGLRANFILAHEPLVFVNSGLSKNSLETKKLDVSSFEFEINLNRYQINTLNIEIYSSDILGYERKSVYNNYISAKDFDTQMNINIVTAETEKGYKNFIDIPENNRVELKKIYNHNESYENIDDFMNTLSFLDDGIHDFIFVFTNKFNYNFEVTLSVLKIHEFIITENAIKPIYNKNNLGYHVVKPGESVYSIAKKYNTSPGDIVYLNNLSDPSKINIGQNLRIGHIDYGQSPIHIEINLSENKLDLFYNNRLLKSYIVAVGRSDATPPGYYKIYYKEKNPALYWKGEYIPPGSIINGIGTRWLQLSNPQYGIHGTTKPWEIGKRISHGCIRMFNFDVEELDFIASLGTEVYVY